MKTILITLFTIFSSFTFGQNVKRLPNEPVESFIKRMMPDSVSLAHPIIETNVWDSSSKSIITFFGYDDTTDINVGYNAIYGHLYIPVGLNTYRNINFGPITEDGGYPEVISVFFANADKGKEKELIVMCKYGQRHYDYDGDFYETFIYSHPGKDDTLTYFKELSEKFWGCECRWREGKTEVAKYKTAGDVKRQLKMGFK